jgi:N,N'-diacetyllegionaminate synthase
MKFIAELCQNHNGDINLMFDMVKAASESGATHVKLQHIFSKNLSFRPQFENGLELDGKTLSIKRPFKAEYDRLKSLELNEKTLKTFIETCKEFNVEPMTTCFTREDVNALYELGFKSIKVASYDCASFQMLREIVAHDWEIVVSTGATFDAELTKAAEILKPHANVSFLHCVTIYPTPVDQLHLKRLELLSKLTDNYGLSDHTLTKRDGVNASKVAIYLGSNIIERHFSILPEDKTKDGPVSVNQEQFSSIVKFSKLSKIEKKQYIQTNIPNFVDYLGTGKRNLTDVEILNRDYYRGRFASRNPESPKPSTMIYNWDEVSL